MKHLWIVALIGVLSCATYDTIKIGDLRQTSWVVDGHYVIVLPSDIATMFSLPNGNYRGQEAWPFYFDQQAGVVVYLLKKEVATSKNAPLLAKTIGLLAAKLAALGGGPTAMVEAFEKERDEQR